MYVRSVAQSETPRSILLIFIWKITPVCISCRPLPLSILLIPAIHSLSLMLTLRFPPVHLYTLHYVIANYLWPYCLTLWLSCCIHHLFLPSFAVRQKATAKMVVFLFDALRTLSEPRLFWIQILCIVILSKLPGCGIPCRLTIHAKKKHSSSLCSKSVL